MTQPNGGTRLNRQIPKTGKQCYRAIFNFDEESQQNFFEHVTLFICSNVFIIFSYVFLTVDNKGTFPESVENVPIGKSLRLIRKAYINQRTCRTFLHFAVHVVFLSSFPI